MALPALRTCALFAGGAGLELGIELAVPGSRAVVYVEREAYAAAALVARMEEATLAPAPVWDDVATFDGRPWRGLVDCVAGGFPCQDISNAGKREGIEGGRSGLWTHFARVIREMEPWLVWVENVAALTVRGLDVVLGDLAEMGFDAEWGCVGADDAGAPHQRERIFILAYARRDGLERRGGSGDFRGAAPAGDVEGPQWQRDGNPARAEGEDVADAERAGRRRPALANDAGLGGVEAEGGAGCSEQGGSPLGRPELFRADVENPILPGLEGPERGELAGADGRRHHPDAGGPSGRRLEELAHADGRHRDEDGAGRDPTGPGGTLARWRAPFPPGPDDSEGWEAYLREYPGTEPAVRRGADGLAYRVERLRLLGNGVVPQQAALAWCLLAQRLGVDPAP